MKITLQDQQKTMEEALNNCYLISAMKADQAAIFDKEKEHFVTRKDLRAYLMDNRSCEESLRSSTEHEKANTFKLVAPLFLNLVSGLSMTKALHLIATNDEDPFDNQSENGLPRCFLNDLATMKLETWDV